MLLVTPEELKEFIYHELKYTDSTKTLSDILFAILKSEDRNWHNGRLYRSLRIKWMDRQQRQLNLFKSPQLRDTHNH